jgi:phosphohistidine phosphatase
MKLYFLRHGLAGDSREWKGDDFARPLTEEGIAKMKRTAETCAKMELDPQLILTSPLIRAYQTAEIIAKRLKLQDKLVEDERLGSQFGIKFLAEILAGHSKADSLMLVGHEPGMSETVSQLIGGGRIDFKKGALACVQLDDAKSLRGALVWLIPPKVLAL